MAKGDEDSDLPNVGSAPVQLNSENNFQERVASGEPTRPPGKSMNREGNRHASVALLFDLEKKVLFAHVAPQSGDNLVDETWLRAALHSQGFADLCVIEEKITEALSGCKENETQAVIPIAEQKDGSLKIDLSDDLMEAMLTVVGPYRGAAVKEEDIKRVLEELKVVRGIRDRAWAEVIESLPALKPGESKRWLIAKGEPAVDGEDTKFVCLFPEAHERKPYIDERDVAHFRELGPIISVDPGERVMKLTLPTGGADGYNVLGKLLEAEPGIELNYKPDLQGVAIDPEDERVLVATIVGQPVVVENGCIVEPVYVIENVGLHTGNIDFNGAVYVKGDVTTGMRITCTGDVIVDGTVEAAVIKAGGDVMVKQGVIGTPTTAESIYNNVSSRPGDWDMRVMASGAVTVGFAANAYVAAKRSIQIKESALHSFIISEEKVKIGHDKEDGGVVGGTTMSKIAIDVTEAGSPACVRTFLRVGLDVFSISETQRPKEILYKKVDSLVRLKDSVLKLNRSSNPDKIILIKRGIETVKRLEDDIKYSKKQLKKLESALERISKKAKIVVRKRIYGGITVSINTFSKTIDDSTFGGQFIIREGDIVLDVPDVWDEDE